MDLLLFLYLKHHNSMVMMAMASGAMNSQGMATAGMLLMATELFDFLAVVMRAMALLPMVILIATAAAAVQPFERESLHTSLSSSDV